MHGAGYRTAAFVQSWVSKPLGFDRGWDLFRHAQESLAEKMPHVLDWIEKNRASPFFVFLYSTDPHYPFLRAHAPENLYGTYASSFDFTLDTIEAVRAGTLHPSPDDIAHAMALYDEGIHWADADLAPLFEYLERSGLSKKTIVVFNADHGEEFDEHGVISHGQTYYDGVVRVPLVIAAPGMARPGRSAAAARPEPRHRADGRRHGGRRASARPGAGEVSGASSRETPGPRSRPGPPSARAPGRSGSAA